MSERKMDKTSLNELVESLEQHEAERELESLRTGSSFDAGVVEGISNAIDQLDAARTGSDLQTFVAGLTSNMSDPEDDEYAKGVAAGLSHVAGVVRDELANLPDMEL